MRASAFLIAAVAAVLLIAWFGRRPPERHWRQISLEPQDGTKVFTVQSPLGGWNAMVAAAPPVMSHMVADVCGRLDGGDVLISRSDYQESARGLRTFRTVVRTAGGDTLVSLPEKGLVCAVPNGEDRDDLLVWYPEVWMSRGDSTGGVGSAAKFVAVMTKDVRFRAGGAFRNALSLARSPARFDASCRLEVVGSDGEPKRSFDFDPRFTPGAGVLYETRQGRVALIETDTAYANSDMFSVLFEQPDIADGEALVARDSDDIEGSYRGLVAADPDSAGVLWYRRLGVMCLKQHVVDLDGDGVDEILLESYGIENDVSGGGITDAGTAYLICLDQGGNILWRKRVLGTYCGVQAAAVDLLGGEGLEIVMAWSSGRHESVGGVAVLDATGRTLAGRTDLGGIYGLVVADLDGDGSLEIAAGGPDGIVSVLAGDLSLERERRLEVPLLETVGGSGEGDPYVGTGVPWKRRGIPVAAADLSGDGVPELLVLESLWARWDVPGGGVVRSGRGDLVALDVSLREMMRAPIDARPGSVAARYPSDVPASMKISTFALDHDGDGSDEIALWTRPGYTFTYWGNHGE